MKPNESLTPAPQDLEGDGYQSHSDDMTGSSTDRTQVDILPFIGRLGASGTGYLPRNSYNEDLLKASPDAAPLMTLSDQFALRPILTIKLWKAALIPILTIKLWKAALMEGVGSKPAATPADLSQGNGFRNILYSVQQPGLTHLLMCSVCLVLPSTFNSP